MLYAMIDWLDLLGLAVIAAVLWFWFDSLKARERAIEEARTACFVENLQLLDEFSTTGNDRANGAIVMRGDQVLLTHLDVAELPTRLIGD